MNKSKNINITIIGAGSWGTTMAILLAEKDYGVNLWVRSRDVYEDILKNRKNKKYTFKKTIPKNVKVYFKDNIDGMLSNIDVLIFAVPSHALRGIIRFFYNNLIPYSYSINAVVNLAKGIELKTNIRLSQVMKEELPGSLKNKIAVLSGPNIAMEIMEKLPSVSVVSSLNKSILKYLQEVFSTDYFRIYTNTDLPGVEISAAVKNIIAIAAGISDGLGYGTNAKASLITRGLYELSKVGLLMGSDLKTFSGVAGMGDLITTCISNKSRNRMVGQRLANGESIDDIKNSMHMVAEGINTTKAVYKIAEDNNIELPITGAVYDIIYNDVNPYDAVRELMTRKFKSEV